MAKSDRVRVVRTGHFRLWRSELGLCPRLRCSGFSALAICSVSRRAPRRATVVGPSSAFSSHGSTRVCSRGGLRGNGTPFAARPTDPQPGRTEQRPVHQGGGRSSRFTSSSCDGRCYGHRRPVGYPSRDTCIICAGFNANCPMLIGCRAIHEHTLSPPGVVLFLIWPIQ